MTCCGQPRATRFCPECGKRIDANPGLSDLLAHCLKTRQTLMNRADKSEKMASQEDLASPWYRDTESYLKEAEDSRKAAGKWKSWADALAAAMDRLAESDPDQRKRPRSEDRGPGGEP